MALSSFYSTLKCFRKIKQANQKCTDCSSDTFDVIICNACSTQCHKDHNLLPITSQFCRCTHNGIMTDSGEYVLFKYIT